jgi:glycosyltransferase involved in cell wall biosynthesis
MRVSIVAPIFEPLGGPQPYGPHAVLVDLARGLQDRGHEVTVHCAAGSSVPGIRLETVEVEAAIGATRVVPGRALAPSVVAFRAFRRLFDGVRAAEPDAVSQHAFDAEAIALTADLPVVHTLHLPPVTPAVVAAVRASSADFVTVSMAARHDWQAAGVAGVGVIRNGVPDTAARGDVEPIALIAGRISPEKGVDTAIRVAHRAGLRPVVVGAIYDQAYYDDHVRPLMDLAEHVPTVPRADLAARMARAAVLLMPIEWNEPFGLVAAEAQMAGCPVVGYRRGALPEVVDEGVGGYLVTPGDEDALVAAIAAARRLDRSTVRASARDRLGVEPMVAAYERRLSALAQAWSARPGPRGADRRSA